MLLQRVRGHRMGGKFVALSRRERAFRGCLGRLRAGALPLVRGSHAENALRCGEREILDGEISSGWIICGVYIRARQVRRGIEY